jgi:hypothetical protein
VKKKEQKIAFSRSLKNRHGQFMTVSVTVPRRMKGDWICVIFFDGPDALRYTSLLGVDSMQAIQNAMDYIAQILRKKRDEWIWCDKTDRGPFGEKFGDIGLYHSPITDLGHDFNLQVENSIYESMDADLERLGVIPDKTTYKSVVRAFTAALNAKSKRDRENAIDALAHRTTEADFKVANQWSRSRDPNKRVVASEFLEAVNRDPFDNLKVGRKA